MNNTEKYYKKYCTMLTNAINNNYKVLNYKIDKNIWRNTRIAMGNCVENEIAKLVNSILKRRDYKYIIDAQLYYGEKNPIRPDILVVDKDNIIRYMFEIKSQMGYCRDTELEDYKSNQDKLCKAKLIKYNRIQFEKGIEKDAIVPMNTRVKEELVCDKNIKTIFVNLMQSNGVSKELKNINGVFYFSLFKKGIWYDSISYENINEDKKHGFKAFIDYISKLQ